MKLSIPDIDQHRPGQYAKPNAPITEAMQKQIDEVIAFEDLQTERYFWSEEYCEVITEKALRADYDELINCYYCDKYETFEQYVNACCDKNGTLQLLRKGPGQFNSAGGNDVGAVHQFSALLEALCSKEKPGCDVKIIVDGYVLEAYDHAALMQGLLDAVNYYAEEIC